MNEYENENAIEELEEKTVEEEVEIKEEEQEEEQEDRIPLATFLKEKAKRKELEKRLKELEEHQEKNIINNTRNKLKEKLIDKGYTEEEAEEEIETKEAIKKIKDDLQSREFKAELKELANSDPFFKDAVLFEQEIKEKIRAVKGMSIEDAYILVRGSSRRKEFQTEVEQRAAAARRAAIQKGGTASAASGVSAGKFKLTDEEKKILTGLQKSQPDANWSAEKLIKMIRR